ncbi:unnamed protein product, partial [Brassica oleracea]
VSEEREIEGVITKSRLRSIWWGMIGMPRRISRVEESRVEESRAKSRRPTWINNFPTRSTVKTIRSLLTRMNVGA